MTAGLPNGFRGVVAELRRNRAEERRVEPIADPTHGQDAGTGRSERAANPLDVNVNGAASRRKRATEGLLVQLPPARDAPAAAQHCRENEPLCPRQRQLDSEELRRGAIRQHRERAQRKRAGCLVE